MGLVRRLILPNCQSCSRTSLGFSEVVRIMVVLSTRVVVDEVLVADWKDLVADRVAVAEDLVANWLAA